LPRAAAARRRRPAALPELSNTAELPAAGRRYGIALVGGQEIITERGHANAFGDIGWVDFRRPAADWLSTVEGRGGCCR
jgi:hypothetical protein